MGASGDAGAHKFLISRRVWAYGILVGCFITTNMSGAEVTSCPELPEFDNRSWTGIQSAFKQAPQWDFNQAWLASESKDFRGGCVRFGWRGDRFCFLATLVDNDPMTHASEDGQRLWELGDVLEFFAGVSGSPAYIEYHVSPNDVTLRLQFPAADSYVEPHAVERFQVKDTAAVAKTMRTENGWMAYGEIPAASMPGGSARFPGQKWQVSFSRYDYDRGRETPVHSSTSPHRELGFHRRHEWREIHFE